MWFIRLAHQNFSEPASGPFRQEELIAKVHERSLGWLDFVIATSGPQTSLEWKLVGEVDFLREALAFESGTSAYFGDWIVLHNPGPTQQMMGPFTKDEIVARIASGVVSYSDLAWQPSVDSWRRIGDCALFDRRAVANAAPAPQTSVESESRVEMKNVMRPKALRATFEQVPEEASGEDLVSSPLWMRLSSCLLISGLIGSTLFAPRTFAAEAKPTQKIEPNLELLPSQLSGAQAALEVRTEAGSKEPVEIHIVGHSGEILEKTSYAKRFQLRSQAGGLLRFELSTLRLPPGRYQIDATSGNLRKDITIFLGIESGEFREKLEAHRRLIANEQQTEKLALFYASEKMEQLANDMSQRYGQLGQDANAWRSFMSRWLKKADEARKMVSEVAASQADAQAYPEQLAQFYQKAKELETRVKSLASVLRSRTVASTGETAGATGIAESLEREFRDLKMEAGALGSGVEDTKKTQ